MKGLRVFLILLVGCAAAGTQMGGCNSSRNGSSGNSGSNGWTKFAGNPVLNPGAQGAWDAGRVQHPSVLKLGANSYMMWYEGQNAAGLISSIGLATSTDGVSWVRLAGNPVLGPGATGAWDSAYVGSPTVVFDGTSYRMGYVGRNSAGLVRIGLATSSDGRVWTKSSSNPVLASGALGAWDANAVGSLQVIRDGSLYRMWYTGTDAANIQRIGYATSSNGTAWTKSGGNPVLNVGTAGTFDAGGAGSPSVIRDGSLLRMWYVGKGPLPGGLQQIGYAESVDGIAWTKSSGNPVLKVGPVGAWDAANLFAPGVLKDGGAFKMWYGGQNAAGTIRIGYATE